MDTDTTPTYVINEPCVICGEQVTDDNDPAEMHDAAMREDPEMWSEAQGGIVHAGCGLERGWVIS